MYFLLCVVQILKRLESFIFRNFSCSRRYRLLKLILLMIFNLLLIFLFSKFDKVIRQFTKIFVYIYILLSIFNFFYLRFKLTSFLRIIFNYLIYILLYQISVFARRKSAWWWKIRNSRLTIILFIIKIYHLLFIILVFL